MKTWLSRLLRYGLILLLVLVVCWGGVYLAARHTHWRPDNSALVMYLVVIPLLVFVATLLLWRGIQAYRQQRAEEAEAARAAQAAQETARMRAEEQEQDRRFDRLAILAGEALTCHAESVAGLRALWEEQDCTLTLPLDAALTDAAGFPLLAGRVPGLEGVPDRLDQRLPALLEPLLVSLEDSVDTDALRARREALLRLPVDEALDRFYQHQPRQRVSEGLAVVVVVPAGLSDAVQRQLRDLVQARLSEVFSGLGPQRPRLMEGDSALSWLAQWQDDTLTQADALACVLSVDSVLDNDWLAEAERAGLLQTSQTRPAARREAVSPGEAAAWLLLGHPAWVDDDVPALGWLGRQQAADSLRAALEAAQRVAGTADAPAEAITAVISNDASAAQSARTAADLAACWPDFDPVAQRMALGQCLGLGADNWVVQTRIAAGWAEAGLVVLLRHGVEASVYAWPVLAALPERTSPEMREEAMAETA